jgi:predicted component of type VI protein secretion system
LGAPPTPGGDPLDVPLSESAAQASFDIFLGENQVARWRMNRMLALVGCSARCRVRLPGPAISRIHCSLVATEQGVWVVDLCTEGGTQLHGQPVPFARLQAGDSVGVGPYCLRVRYRQAAATVPTVAPASRGTSAVEVLPAGSNGLGVPPTSALVSDPNPMISLVQEFNALQQQMFDQFQQTLVMLVQMMSSMHKEQVALIREEMRQFQQVSQELQQLQEQARSGRAAAVEAPSGPLPSPPGAIPLPAQPRATEEADGGTAVHDWLAKRISDLQSDRQSRWQRIVGFLRGN